MTERDLESQCMGELRKGLPFALLWKIRDQTTGGQPDLEVAWNGHTTKLEFKVLEIGQSIHSKWEDERQLITLVRYEQQTGHSWIVAWRKGYRKTTPPQTILYRPTCLLNHAEPRVCDWKTTAGLAPRLWETGAIGYTDIRHDVVTELIRQTHI